MLVLKAPERESSGTSPDSLKAHFDYAQSPLDNKRTLPESTKDDWFKLSWLLQRSSSRRFAYRMLWSIALSLALSQMLLCLLAAAAPDPTALVVHFLTTTLFWMLLYGILAGWLLSQGFFDRTTARFLEEQLRRRGRPKVMRQQLELLAQTTWLTLVMLLPIAAVGVTVLVRARSLQVLLELSQVLGLCLFTCGMAAFGISVAAYGARRVSPDHPKQLAALVIVAPELLRLVDPTIPTLRTIARSTQTCILYWSGWS